MNTAHTTSHGIPATAIVSDCVDLIGTSPKSLVQKLAEVMAAVERIPKRGHNEFHNYDYATESDIVATVRKELAARHVMLLPSVEGMQRESVGEKGNVLTTIQMKFTFVDGDTGETLERPWMGAGTDKEDKGLYKAMTGGEKYFLLKTFLMPTGDDPEKEDAKEKTRAAKATATPQRQPAAQAQSTPASGDTITTLLKAVKPGRAGSKGELVTDAGEAFLCYDVRAVAFAEQACQDGVLVTLTIARSTSGNRYVKTLKRAESVPVTEDAKIDREIAEKEGLLETVL